jgi:ribosomal RNA-processing protein 9
MSSFFTLPASQRKRKRLEKDSTAPRSKSQNESKSRPARDESISGSDVSDDDVPRNDATAEVSSDEDEEFFDEDPAAKRIRLAEQYLANTRKEVEEEVGFDAKDVDQENLRRRMGDRLKEDTAETKGKLYRWIASDYDWSRATRCQFRHHQKPVTGIAVAAGFAYTVGKDSILVKWRLPSIASPEDSPNRSRKPTKLLVSSPFGKPTSTTNRHTSAIRCIAASQDGKFVATGATDSSLIVWDANTLKPLKVFNHHRDAVLSLAFRRGTNQLFSASRDRTVKIWSLDELAYVETLFGHQDEVVDISALAEEICFTVGARDRTARLWKVVEESQLVFRGGGAPRHVNPYDSRPLSHEGSLDRIACIDNEIFVTGADNGSIALWNVHKKKPVNVVPLAHGLDPPPPLEEISAEEVPSEKERGQPKARWITALRAIPFSDVFVSGSWDGFVRVWRVSKDRRKIESLGRIGVSIDGEDVLSGLVNGEREAAANGIEEDEGVERSIPGIVNDLAIMDVGDRGKSGVMVLAAVGKELRAGRWKVEKDGKNCGILFEVPRMIVEKEHAQEAATEKDTLVNGHAEEKEDGFEGFD